MAEVVASSDCFCCQVFCFRSRLFIIPLTHKQKCIVNPFLPGCFLLIFTFISLHRFSFLGRCLIAKRYLFIYNYCVIRLPDCTSSWINNGQQYQFSLFAFWTKAYILSVLFQYSQRYGYLHFGWQRMQLHRCPHRI